MATRATEWQRLPTSLAQLCINTTLRCGQAFRWRKSAEDEWSMALHGRILSLRQDATHLHYRAIYPSVSSAAADLGATNTPQLVRHYLNLDVDLGQLYEHWAAADANFKKKAPKFTGIRILRQDAWEALVAFICSSNNNISRISGMVHNLCLHYGPLLGHIDDVAYHDFPTPEALCKPGVEAHLAKLGFGYRAKYIAKTAHIIACEKGLEWLHDLSNPEYPQFQMEVKPGGDFSKDGRQGYQEARHELTALHGVGPKVADCVCLFGLGWSEAVPVDTHVWQIAQRDYKFGKGKHRSLTAATYDAVAGHFRKLWGKEAGWAHSVLFTADLKAFSERVVAKTEIQEEQISVKEEGGEMISEHQVRLETVKRKRVQKDVESHERHVMEVKEVVSKRRKRGRG